MNLFARHVDHEEQVLEAVELEHVGHGQVAGLDDGVERERGVERYVGPRQLQLQVVYQVAEGRVAKEAVAGVDIVLESSDVSFRVLLDFVYLRLEVADHFLVNGQVAHVHVLALDVFLHELAIPVGQLNLRVAHLARPARRVQQQHLLASAVLHPEVVLLMVVAEEDDVEARHLLGHGLGGVFFILGRDDAAAKA